MSVCQILTSNGNTTIGWVNNMPAIWLGCFHQLKVGETCRLLCADEVYGGTGIGDYKIGRTIEGMLTWFEVKDVCVFEFEKEEKGCIIHTGLDNYYGEVVLVRTAGKWELHLADHFGDNCIPLTNELGNVMFKEFWNAKKVYEPYLKDFYKKEV